MGVFQIQTLYNSERFQSNKFRDEKFLKKSRMAALYLDSSKPTWTHMTIEQSQLFDETDWLQFGQMNIENYYDYSFGLPEVSDMKDWPTKENPYKQYKFGAAWVELSTKLNVVARSTYSLLDWLGDIGGLFGMLQLLGGALLGPFTLFNMKVHLLQQLYNVNSTDLR